MCRGSTWYSGYMTQSNISTFVTSRSKTLTTCVAIVYNILTACVTSRSKTSTACVAIQSNILTSCLAIQSKTLTTCVAIQSDILTLCLAIQSKTLTACVAIQSNSDSMRHDLISCSGSIFRDYNLYSSYASLIYITFRLHVSGLNILCNGTVLDHYWPAVVPCLGILDAVRIGNSFYYNLNHT
jgi:hypothetical protein